MPYTRKQLARILKFDGHSLVDTALPLTVRVCDVYSRRRAFVAEDAAITDIFDQYRAAYKDLREYADEAAKQYHVETLANDAATVYWRRAFLAKAEPRLKRLGDDVAQTALNAAYRQYFASFYAKAWLLSQYVPDAPIDFQQPTTRDAMERVLHGQLREAYEPDALLYDMLGVEWRDQYKTELDSLIGKMKASLSGAVQNNIGYDAAARNLASIMGIDTGDKGSFTKINTISRTYFMGAANSGALDLYAQNAGLVQGSQFVATLSDGRTCPKCMGYNGQKWALDDPSRIVPPYDTHPNCRCTLIPVLFSSITPISDSTPPAQTLPEWLLGAGLGWLWGELFGGQKNLDSNRVGDEYDYEDEYDLVGN